MSTVPTITIPVTILGPNLRLPTVKNFKVRVAADADPTHAIGRSLERRTGLTLINIKEEGANQERGLRGDRIISRNYEATLGTRTGNSYRIDRVVKFTIPATR